MFAVVERTASVAVALKFHVLGPPALAEWSEALAPTGPDAARKQVARPHTVHGRAAIALDVNPAAEDTDNHLRAEALAYRDWAAGEHIASSVVFRLRAARAASTSRR